MERLITMYVAFFILNLTIPTFQGLLSKYGRGNYLVEWQIPLGLHLVMQQQLVINAKEIPLMSWAQADMNHYEVNFTRDIK